MNNRKRGISGTILWLVIITIGVSSILNNGCGRRNESSEGIITLQFFHTLDAFRLKVWKEKIISRFEKEHPNIKIKMIAGYSEGTTKLQTMIAGGTPPDVMMIDGYFESFAAKGSLMNLEPFLARDKDFSLDDYYDFLVKECKYKGIQYGLPEIVSIYLLAYNKTMFDKFGVKYPDENITWDMFLEMAKRLTQDLDGDRRIDQYGYTDTFTWYTNRIWIWANGVTQFSENNTECLLNRPEAVEAIQSFLDLKNKHNVMAHVIGGSVSDQAMFMTGRVGMYRAGSYEYGKLCEIKNFDWGLSLLPRIKIRVTVDGTNVHSISSKTKHPQEAWEFLKFIVGPESQKISAQYMGRIPGLRSLVNSKYFLDPEDPDVEKRRVFVKALTYTREDECRVENRHQIDFAMGSVYDQIYVGEVSVKEGCEKITKEVNKLLKRGEGG